jgi:hypothetical protein
MKADPKGDRMIAAERNREAREQGGYLEPPGYRKEPSIGSDYYKFTRLSDGETRVVHYLTMARSRTYREAIKRAFDRPQDPSDLLMYERLLKRREEARKKKETQEETS